MTPQTNGTTDLALVMGGEELDVSYLDGQTERVKVRLMPIKRMGDYLSAIADEEKSIELFCGKPTGWAETLTPVSQLALYSKGQALNLPLFETWYPEFQKRTEVLRPGFLKGLDATVARAVETAKQEASASANSAPSSASAPASP